MNTDYFTALGTCPPFLFILNEKSYADASYAFQIFNHTHSILGSITRIQMVEIRARKTLASPAICGSFIHQVDTILDAAHNAGLRFVGIIPPASRAGFLNSHIGEADSTVHSAGRDELRADCVSFFCRHSYGLIGSMWGFLSVRSRWLNESANYIENV